MNCKFCNAELPEDVTLCPECGKEQEVAEEIVEAAAEAVEETVAAEETPAPVADEKSELPFGTDYEAPEQAENKEAAKAAPGKIALAVVAGVVVLAILVALVISGLGGAVGEADPTIAPTSGMMEETEPVVIPSDGDPSSPLCKASYTVSEEEAVAAADVVVATMGDKQLTNGELQAYYWQEVYMFLSENGMYAQSLGLDLTAPLDQQLFTLSEVPMSWQQFFLDGAIGTWKSYQAMELESQAAEFQLTEEQQEEFDSEVKSLHDAASAQGYESTDALIKDRVGAGCSEEAYVNYARVICYCMSYYDYYYENVEVSEEEIDAFYAENEEHYTSNKVSRDDKYVDVRHVLIQPEGGETGADGYPVYTDEAWENCRLKVEEIYNKWQEGDKSEESFAALANQESVDGGSNTNGGLYQNVYVGQMVKEFEDWCFDETRMAGDHGLVKTSYGYHIMYFCTSRGAVEYDLRSELAYNLLSTVVEKYPSTVDYSLIELDALDIA